MKTQQVGIALVLWLVAAATAVAAGLLARVPPPAVVAVLAALVVFVSFAAPGLRQWVRTADLRLLLVPHLIRFVGVVFLILVSRGVLAPAFTPIGWGDTVAASGALVLLLVGLPITSSGRWWTWLAWNSFGLADMALLVVTGIRLATTAPEQFTLFRHLPFGLLPTFAVPLIIATHVFIYIRLFMLRGRSAA